MEEDIKKEVEKDVVVQEKNINLEDKIVDIFKFLLGYNWHLMGIKKKF